MLKEVPPRTDSPDPSTRECLGIEVSFSPRAKVTTAKPAPDRSIRNLLKNLSIGAQRGIELRRQAVDRIRRLFSEASALPQNLPPKSGKTWRYPDWGQRMRCTRRPSPVSLRPKLRKSYGRAFLVMKPIVLLPALAYRLRCD